MSYDLVIIGSGFAGLAALKKSLELGMKTCLVFQDHGATQFFSGAFDVVDPRPHQHFVHPRLFPSLKTALHEFILSHPQHPYADCIGLNEGAIADFLDEMKAFFDFYKIPVMADERFLVTFGSSGWIKPTAFALKTQALKVSEVDPERPVVIVNFPLLADYHAHTITHEIKKLFTNVRVVDLKALPVNRTAGLAQLLSDLDEPQHYEHFKNTLKEHTRKGDLVFLPPMLGIKSAFTHHAGLEHSLGIRVIELLSVLPSSAGLRLQHILKEFFSSDHTMRQHLDLALARVTGFDRGGANEIATVHLKDKTGTERKIAGRFFLLATGKFLGGGIRKDPLFKESLFDLPLFYEGGGLAPDKEMTHLINPNPVAPQPWEGIGIRVNGEATPIQPYTAEPPYANLKACGHVLSGFAPMRERIGFGVSLATALKIFNKTPSLPNSCQTL